MVKSKMLGIGKQLFIVSDIVVRNIKRDALWKRSVMRIMPKKEVSLHWPNFGQNEHRKQSVVRIKMTPIADICLDG